MYKLWSSSGSLFARSVLGITRHTRLLRGSIPKSSLPHFVHHIRPYSAPAMTHEEVNEEWKKNAPYKIHEEGSFDARYDASCHCGKVKYQLSREKPLDAKYCHCTTCQRLHGE